MTSNSSFASLPASGAAPGILVLFDIDGTLLTAGDAPRRALEEALVAVYGVPGPATTHDFAGKTDPQIVRELLALAGLPGEQIEAGLGRALDAYVQRLEAYLGEDRDARLLPGIAELVPRLAREPRAALGLLTGNVIHGARVKLSHFGLWQHFALGAFGSDSGERDRLPEFAVTRALERWGVRFPPERTFVVGDTPMDIAAGRAIGAITVAVDTGRRPGGLAAHAPDHLFADLAEWRSTLWPVLFGERFPPSAE
jgi:phosphoglycolate phosphatase-like HAD superfamily hydrolase